PTTETSSAARTNASRTHECSTAVVTTCPDAPNNAALTDSLPDEVNTTSRGRAPKNEATDARAFSNATRAARPPLCTRPGSPNDVASKGSIGSRAAGRNGEVDAWSRYARVTLTRSAHTRVTQCSPPSGRLSVIVGDVAPYRPSSIPLTMPVSTAHSTCGYCR